MDSFVRAALSLGLPIGSYSAGLEDCSLLPREKPRLQVWCSLPQVPPLLEAATKLALSASLNLCQILQRHMCRSTSRDRQQNGWAPQTYWLSGKEVPSQPQKLQIQWACFLAASKWECDWLILLPPWFPPLCAFFRLFPFVAGGKQYRYGNKAMEHTL